MLMKLTTAVIADILKISFCHKNTNPNCKPIKDLGNNSFMKKSCSKSFDEIDTWRKPFRLLGSLVKPSNEDYGKH